MPDLSIEEAYRKWGDDLIGYAAALVGPAEAPDLVADAFAAVLARGEEEWARVREPRGYLFRAVLNAARMRDRAARRRHARELRWATPTSASGELLADPSVVRLLDGLSVRQRAVTYLTYWEDMDAATIGDLLGISEGTVKRHLERARRALRPLLSHGGAT